MRERQSIELGARIVIGGKIGRPGDGYLGRMPGVLEEALLGIRAQRPVYLVGAFGGCARLVLDALDGVERSELTWAHHQALPHAEELKKLYVERGLHWDDYEAIANELKTCGISGLKNGLTVEENRELATTRSAERIVDLILRGLQECHPPAATSGKE